VAWSEVTEAVEWVLRHFFPSNHPPNEYEGGRGSTFTPPTKPCTGNHGTAGGFDHGDHDAACGGTGRPRRSDWWWVASTTAAMARRRSGLAQRQWVVSEIRLVAGGFDHGGHGLHHGSTTSMAVGSDLGSTRQFFLFLKISL
jgi:hypothetical protein